MPDTTFCLICRRVTQTRPYGDPINNVRICVETASCFIEWLHLLNGPELDRLLEYVTGAVLHNNTKLGKCPDCGYVVYTASSYVYVARTQPMYLHYGCYMRRATTRLQEALDSVQPQPNNPYHTP